MQHNQNKILNEKIICYFQMKISVFWKKSFIKKLMQYQSKTYKTYFFVTYISSKASKVFTHKKFLHECSIKKLLLIKIMLKRNLRQIWRNKLWKLLHKIITLRNLLHFTSLIVSRLSKFIRKFTRNKLFYILKFFMYKTMKKT